MNPILREIVPANAQVLGARERQEDAFAFSRLDDEFFIAHGGVAAVLCDGMGGLQFGAEAAAIGVHEFLRAYREKSEREPIGEALTRAVNEANEAVFAFAKGNAVVNRVGATLAVAVVRGVELHCIHAGDSRIYLFSQGRLTQVTEDHNYGRVLGGFVERGEITAEEAEQHPRRDHLTSYLGRQSLPELSLLDPPRRLAPGDWVLLCSDGLHGVLNDDEIAAELFGDCSDAAQRLVDRVIGRGMPEQDNVTVLLLHIQPDGSVRRSGRFTHVDYLGADPAPAASSSRDLSVPGAAADSGLARLMKGRAPWAIATIPLWIAAGVALWPQAGPERSPQADAVVVRQGFEERAPVTMPAVSGPIAVPVTPAPAVAQPPAPQPKKPAASVDPSGKAADRPEPRRPDAERARKEQKPEPVTRAPAGPKPAVEVKPVTDAKRPADGKELQETRPAPELKPSPELKAPAEVKPVVEPRPAAEPRPVVEPKPAVEARPAPEVKSATEPKPPVEAKPPVKVKPPTEVAHPEGGAH